MILEIAVILIRAYLLPIEFFKDLFLSYAII